MWVPYTDVIQLEWALRYTWTYNVQLGLIYILYLLPNDGQNSFRRSIRMSTSTSQPTPNPSRRCRSHKYPSRPVFDTATTTLQVRQPTTASSVLLQRRLSLTLRLPTPRAPYSLYTYRMQRNTTGIKPNHGKRAQKGYSFS